MMVQAKLVLVGGDIEPSEIELQLPAKLGRGRDCGVFLPYPLVSRRHCEIVAERGKLVVRDLGSLNGTFVGCHRITRAELGHGDLLTVGSVTFRAIYQNPKSAGDDLDTTPVAAVGDQSIVETVRLDESPEVPPKSHAMAVG
jgi:adenylate cyclase